MKKADQSMTVILESIAILLKINRTVTQKVEEPSLSSRSDQTRICTLRYRSSTTRAASLPNSLPLPSWLISLDAFSAVDLRC
jgi:hypothetical protein